MNRNQGSLLTSIYTIIALAITFIFFFPLWWSISNSLRIPKKPLQLQVLGFHGLILIRHWEIGHFNYLFLRLI